MQYLRKNTAVIVSVGPFLDKGDGVTLETALTITNEKITVIAETDDGSAPTLVLDNVTGATSGTDNDLNYITNNDAGMMQLELTAANTNRVGRLRIVITDAANHCPVFHEYEILPAEIYDAMIAGTSLQKIDVDTIKTQAVTCAAPVTIPASLASPTNITAASGITLAAATHTGAVIPTVTNLTNLPAAPTDWLTGASVKADAVTKIQSGLALAATALSTATWTAEKAGFLDQAVSTKRAVTLAAADVTGNVTANVIQVDSEDVTLGAIGVIGIKRKV